MGGGPPPAQGGIQILGKGEAVTTVVDVPVLMQLLFQQSLQYVFVKVLQIPFIVRLCEHSVVHRHGYSQCKLFRNRRIPQGSSWNGC